MTKEKLYISPIVTEITPAGTWYEAEPYHQEYFSRNPFEGYCTAVVVATKGRQVSQAVLCKTQDLGVRLLHSFDNAQIICTQIAIARLAERRSQTMPARFLMNPTNSRSRGPLLEGIESCGEVIKEPISDQPEVSWSIRHPRALRLIGCAQAHEVEQLSV